MTVAADLINAPIKGGTHSWEGGVEISTTGEAAVQGGNDSITLTVTNIESDQGNLTITAEKAHAVLAELKESKNISVKADGSITIAAGENDGDGIYVDDGSAGDITLTADTDDNTINAGNNGIDHRGNQTISLFAKNGKNVIETGKGDGLRLEGPGSIVLEADTNSIKAADNGIQVTGGKVSLTASQDNSISGGVSGIEITEGGWVDLSADSDHTIKGSTYGVKILDGTLNINSADDYAGKTTIEAISTSNDKAVGIYVGVEDHNEDNAGRPTSNVNIYSNSLSIYAEGKNDSSWPTVAGILVEDNDGTINIHTTKDDEGKGIVIQSVGSNIDTNTDAYPYVKATSFGIKSQNSTVDLSADGSIKITTAFDGKGAASGLYASVSKVNAADNSISLTTNDSITIEAKTESGTAYGVQLNYNDNATPGYSNSVSLSAGKDISITSKNNSQAENMDAHGVLVSGGTFTAQASGSTNITSYKTSDPNGFVNSYGIYVGSDSDSPSDSSATITSLNNNEIDAGTAVYARGEKSSVTLKAQEGSNLLTASSTGLVAQQGATVSLNAAKGFNRISADGTAIYATGEDSLVTLVALEKDNLLTASSTGLIAEQGATVSLSAAKGFNSISADGTAIYATGEKSSVTLEALEKSNLITDSTYGLLAYPGASISLSAAKGFNSISAGKYAIYAMGENSFVTLEALEGNNLRTTSSSYGLLASQGASVSLSAAKGFNSISANGTAIYAADENSSVILAAQEGNNHLTSTTYGIRASAGATVSLNAAKGFNSISADGSAIYATGENSFVTLEALEGSNLLTSSSSGLVASEGASVSLSAANGINSIKTDSTGIFTYGNAGSRVTLNGISNEVVANTFGIYTSGSSSVSLQAATGDNTIRVAPETEGEFGDFGTRYAIFNMSNSTTKLTAENGSNLIFGSIYATSDDNDTDVNLATSVELAAQTNYVNSFSVIGNAGDLKGKDIISAIYAQGSDGVITLTGRNVIRTYADAEDDTMVEHAVWAYDDADITLTGWSDIRTNRYEVSPNSLDVAIVAGKSTASVEGDNTVVAPEDYATVTLNYGNDANGSLSFIEGDILAAYAGKVDINSSNANAGISIHGNLAAGNNGILNVSLGKSGHLQGRIDDYGDVTGTDDDHADFYNPVFSSKVLSGGEVNLTMGAGSSWDVIGQSWLTKLTTNHDAISETTPLINLRAENGTKNSTHALTIGELDGNAVFNINLDADRDVSDMLYIKEANGTYLVNLQNAVTLADMYALRTDGTRFDGLRFATLGTGSNANFRVVSTDSGVFNVEYEVGTDAYDTSTENTAYNGSNLTASKPGNDQVNDFFEDEPLETQAGAAAEGDAITETTNFKIIGRLDDTPSDAGRTILNMSRANYANAVYLDTLNKRQGEMRYAKGREDGLWVRLRHDEIGKKKSFEAENTMVEVGLDTLRREESGEYHIGAAFDYLDGDTDYFNVTGDGDLNRYGAWLYTTWLGDKGDYWDFVFKYGHLENDFQIRALSSGDLIRGDYDNNVFSVSFEYGRKYANEKRWYIEPQVQAQYAYVTSADYVTNQNTKVSLDSIDSLIARAGVRIGKDFDTEKPMTFYVRGDIMHEFLGEQDIRAVDGTGSMHVRYDNDDTWYTAGLGFSMMQSEDMYYFIEAEKVFGASNTGSYTISGGFRYMF